MMKKLVGKKCFLSPITTADAETMCAWINDQKTAMLVGDEGHSTITAENIKKELQQMQERRAHMYAIHDLESEKLIGRTLLMGVDAVNRTAMLGIIMGEKSYWGKGYGTEAVRLMLDFGFNGLNLHNINLGTYSFNVRAIRCYEKIGFKLIGRRREARIIGNQKFDIIYMDILSSEFTSPIILPLLQEIQSDFSS